MPQLTIFLTLALIVFGLVFDPKGPWGIGIVDVANESDAHTLGSNDLAVKD